MLLRFIILLFIIGKPVSAQYNLQHYLESIENKAKVSLIIQDLQGKILYEQNSLSKIPSASIIKIPILFTLFSQVEEGKIQLEEKHQLIQDDIVGGTGEIQHQPVGGYYSMETLAREMIRVSDNTATNIIIRRLGMSSTNNMMENIGLHSTQLNRLMMDFDAIAMGKQNYTSPTEMNKLLLMLHSHDFLSTTSRELM
ncbi:MAG TPA: serine hydrolase [Anditalea sp.]|nr:serine hydrolase [Anditalea sp.]